ncbi:hypothetical protein BGW80DRAFT_228478 [Lactifluus volemus]|nr:hypothetical protein BGW80DRAFT_228478 [Lactifluus volemus]
MRTAARNLRSCNDRAKRHARRKIPAFACLPIPPPTSPLPKNLMVNYDNPRVLIADYIAFVKFVHTLDGLYIWEYFTSLWFEWSFITGEQRYRWSIWVYAFTRLATLITVFTNIVGYNVRTEINCRVWLGIEFISAYTAFVLGSFLMILRIYAIWGGNKRIVAVSVVAWLINIVFLVRSIVITSSYWDPRASTCVLNNRMSSRANATATFCSEFFLLLLMLVGLIYQRDHYLGRLLFNQGLVWLFVATVVEIPPVVFLFLNLNEPWDVMFLHSSLVGMTICVTRMYRGLSAITDHHP